MAYAFTETRVTDRTQGRQSITIQISETDAAAGSEFLLDGLPKQGRIVSYRTTLLSGTGATINPKIGISAAFVVDTQGHVGSNTTTAAHINDQVALGYASSAGKIYIRSSVNAGTNNAIDTEIVIVEGGQN